MVMWVNMARKETLRENFVEDIKVEQEMLNLGTNPESREKKDRHSSKNNKDIKLNLAFCSWKN